MFFLIELTGGVVTLLSTWISVRLFGLTGLGISFLVTYVIYYFVVWAVIRREVPLVWSKSNQRMLIAGIAAAIVVRILPSTRFGALITPVALALAASVGIPSLIVVWREFKGKNVWGRLRSGQKRVLWKYDLRICLRRIWPRCGRRPMMIRQLERTVTLAEQGFGISRKRWLVVGRSSE